MAGREFGWPAALDTWRAVQDEIFAQVMRRGRSDGRRAVTRHFGGDVLDASLLLIPRTGLINPTDPAWLSVLDAIERVRRLRVGFLRGRSRRGRAATYRLHTVRNPSGVTYVHFAATVMRMSGTTEVAVLCPVRYAGRRPRTPVIAFVCSSIAVAGVVSALNTAA